MNTKSKTAFCVCAFCTNEKRGFSRPFRGKTHQKLNDIYSLVNICVKVPMLNLKIKHRQGFLDSLCFWLVNFRGVLKKISFKRKKTKSFLFIYYARELDSMFGFLSFFEKNENELLII